MSSLNFSGLPRQDQFLLWWAGYLVPVADRAEWTRAWQAELWWCRHALNASQSSVFFTDLSVGLCRDALWLRLASWERVLRGTAVLCLCILAGSCGAAALLAVCLYGGWRNVDTRLDIQLPRFLYAAPLVLFVNFATATRRPVDTHRGRARWQGLQQGAFFAAKMTLLLQLAYLLSLDLCAPVALAFPSTGDYLQLLLFVVVSLLGLRWAFRDQDVRCKRCLRLLNEPMRVGRPSNNLLTWSGTELACRQGHGQLTIPELETSWHQSSEWSTRLVP